MLKWNDEDPDLQRTKSPFEIAHFINNIHPNANSKLAILNIYLYGSLIQALVNLSTLSWSSILSPGPLRQARNSQWLSS